MSGLAALRSGCGLAALAVPAGARQLMTQHPHALIVRSVPDGNAGWFTPDSIDELETIRSRAGVVALGPGFGLHKESAAVVERVLSWNLPVVVDADGLKLLAQIPNCLPRQAPTVLTPHPGEMRTLLDGFGLEDLKKESRTAQACGLAEKVQCHIVLKGLGTVVAAPDGAWSLNTSGTNALATGGTGDVLTGLIAGLLAQKMNISAACRTGVFMHGRAAEVAPIGSRALLADDLLDSIDGVFRELTPFY